MECCISIDNMGTNFSYLADLPPWGGKKGFPFLSETMAMAMAMVMAMCFLNI